MYFILFMNNSNLVNKFFCTNIIPLVNSVNVLFFKQ